MAERLKHPFVWLALLLCIGGGAYWYWRTGQRYESTDNAYVNAHIVHIASQVTGQVIDLKAEENDLVAKDAPLLQIDPQSFQIAVDRATAQLEQARYQVKRGSASLRDAEALLRQREAELQNADTTNTRTQELYRQHLAPKEKADLAETQLHVAEAALDSARARLAAEQANLGSAGDRNEGVRQAAAALEQAKLDLRNCDIASPVAGHVTNMSVRTGDLVAKNQTLFAVIDDAEFWIDANFKETQLTHIKPGQDAEIRIDMYPGQVLHGKVASISSGSGTAFSLLPTQNATGNWVKIAQRVPVRISILDRDPTFPLRIGTSGSVRVKISDSL